MFLQQQAIKLINNKDFHKFSERLLKDEVIAIYIYGSVAYGCKELYDDLDLIVVTKETTVQKLKIEYEDFLIDYNIYSEHDFDVLLKIHDFGVIECMYLPNDFYYGKKPMFKINKQVMRSSVSALVSNSWVKAKKKFEENDFYKGKKSLWHSLRILSFSIDLLTYDKINYDSFNFLYKEIVQNPNNDYSFYKTYKNEYNSLSSEFKKLASKI